MNQNGFPNSNFLEGPIFIDGNTDIDGNLDVSGTINGGSGPSGNVNNPMTSNLDANNYQINNISSISGLGGGQILTTELNLQNNVIRNVNLMEVKELYNNIEGQINFYAIINANGQNITNVDTMTLLNGLSFNSAIPIGSTGQALVLNGSTINYADVITNPLTYDIIGDNHSILNISEITAGDNGFIGSSSLDLQDNNISSVNTLTMSSGLIFNNDEPIGTAGQALILGAGGVVAYSDVLTNPLAIDLQANDLNILNVQTLASTYIDTSNINPLTGNTINILGYLDMNSHGLRRLNTITCRTTATPSVDLKLDLVPATLGTANQVLARDPSFNPAGAGFTKTVWLDAVLNPMTANLNANSNTITNLSGIGSPNGGLDTLILNGDIKSNAGNFISGITNITGHGITPTINLNGDVVITTSLDLGTKNINRCEVLDVNYLVSNTNSAIRFNSPIYLETDMNASAKNIYNVAGLTCSNNSTLPPVSLNLDLVPLTEGTANQVLARDPAFNPANPATYKLVWQTPSAGSGVTNPMTSNLGGGGYTITNLSSLTTTELKVASINLASGSIIQSSAMAINTQLKVNTINTLTNPTILMPSVDFSGTVKTNTINPYSGTSINISATNTNISNHLNVLTNRSPSIGVRTTIFKTFGAMPNVNINSLSPVKLNSVIAAQKGDYIIPAGGFENGDKFIITMYGLLTSVGSGSLNIFIFVGALAAVTFGVINVASTAQPCKFTFEIDCTVSGNSVNLSNNTAMLSVERTNTSIRFSNGTSSTLIPNDGLSNSIDIYVSQTATQVSSFTPLSYTIEQL